MSDCLKNTPWNYIFLRIFAFTIAQCCASTLSAGAGAVMAGDHSDEVQSALRQGIVGGLFLACVINIASVARDLKNKVITANTTFTPSNSNSELQEPLASRDETSMSAKRIEEARNFFKKYSYYTTMTGANAFFGGCIGYGFMPLKIQNFARAATIFIAFAGPCTGLLLAIGLTAYCIGGCQARRSSGRPATLIETDTHNDPSIPSTTSALVMAPV